MICQKQVKRNIRTLLREWLLLRKHLKKLERKWPERGTRMAGREPKKLTDEQKKRLKDPKYLMALKAVKSSKKRTRR